MQYSDMLLKIFLSSKEIIKVFLLSTMKNFIWNTV